MSSPWTQIPTAILDEEKTQQGADTWARQQTAKIADAWAQAQKSALAQTFDDWTKQSQAVMAPSQPPEAGGAGLDVPQSVGVTGRPIDTNPVGAALRQINTLRDDTNSPPEAPGAGLDVPGSVTPPDTGMNPVTLTMRHIDNLLGNGASRGIHDDSAPEAPGAGLDIPGSVSSAPPSVGAVASASNSNQPAPLQTFGTIPGQAPGQTPYGTSASEPSPTAAIGSGITSAVNAGGQAVKDTAQDVASTVGKAAGDVVQAGLQGALPGAKVTLNPLSATTGDPQSIIDTYNNAVKRAGEIIPLALSVGETRSPQEETDYQQSLATVQRRFPQMSPENQAQMAGNLAHGAPSGVNPLRKLIEAYNQTDPNLDPIARIGPALDMASSHFDQAVADLSKNDQSGGLVSGAEQTAIGIARNPLNFVGVTKAMAVGQVVGAMAGYAIAQMRNLDSTQTAEAMQQGSGLGMVVGGFGPAAIEAVKGATKLGPGLAEAVSSAVDTAKRTLADETGSLRIGMGEADDAKTAALAQAQLRDASARLDAITRQADLNPDDVSLARAQRQAQDAHDLAQANLYALTKGPGPENLQNELAAQSRYEITPTGEQRIPIWAKPLQDIGDTQSLNEVAQAVEGAKPTALPSGRKPPAVLGEPADSVPLQPRSTAERKPPDVIGAPVDTGLPHYEGNPLYPVEKALAQPTEPVVKQLEQAKDTLLRKYYDRLYPLKQLDEEAGLDANQGAHAMGQILSGAAAAGEHVVDENVMPLIKNVGQDIPYLEQYWMLQSDKDILTRYPHSALAGGVSGWGGVLNAEKALKAKLGPERFAKLEQAAQQLWKLNDTYRLKPLEDAGIISHQDRMDLRNTNPHYLPSDRYEYSASNPEALIPRQSNKLSVASSGIQSRTAGGSALALDQPLARWVADLVHTQVVVSRNRAANAIVDALKQAEGRTGQRLMVTGEATKMAEIDATTTTSNRGTISYFDPQNPGVKMVANVPGPIASAAKNLEAEAANTFTQFVGKLAMPLRVGATSLSLSFMPVNALRDLQTAWAREHIMPADYWRGLAAALTKNTDFGNAAMAGVLHSGLLESQKPVDALKIVAGMQPISVATAQDALALIPRLVRLGAKPLMRANEVIEQAPRIATYTKLKADGLSELEAAVRARNVTVDFDKMGDSMRTWNQMIPFLNARLQGGANAVGMIRNNPKQALVYMSPFITAEVLSQMWNQRFATSSMIPQYEYDRNWVLQVGEGTENPDPRTPAASAQKFPVYIKIPKGDVAAIATAPVRVILTVAFAQNDRSVVENVLQGIRSGRAAQAGLHGLQAAAQGLTPVDPTGQGAVSLIAPPLAQTLQGLQSNYDTFRGRDIVPQSEMQRPPEMRYDQTTTKDAVALGQQFHVSPRLIDYAIQSYTGGLGQQTQWLADLALGALGYNPQVPGAMKEQKPTETERIAKLPIASRFVGVRNTQAESQNRQSLQDAVDQERELLYQNPEVKRFGIGFAPVANTISFPQRPNVKVPLEGDEQTQFQQIVAQQEKKQVDALTARSDYPRADDAAKRKVMTKALETGRSEAELLMLRQIGSDEINRRLNGARSLAKGA